MVRLKNYLAGLSGLALLALVSGSSCGLSDSPIVLEAVHLVQNDCKLDTSRQLTSGTLNLAQVNDYIIGIAAHNNMESLGLSGGSAPLPSELERGTRNTFVFQELAIKYTATPSVPIQSAKFPITGAIAPVSDYQLTAGVLTDAAILSLRDALQADPTTPIRVKMTMTLNGKLAYGAPMSSNPITFQIVVKNQPAIGPNETCTKYARNGPCGSVGGQDDKPLLCCTQAPTGTPGCT